MQYDIASKVLMDHCRDEIIRRFAGIECIGSELLTALPHETASLKRSDFPVMVEDARGNKTLAIIEIQSAWNRVVPLNVLDYRTRFLIKNDVKAVSCVILLKPSGSAVDHYKDDEVSFKFRLVKIYELDAREFVNNGPVCLLPFVPLMKDGLNMAARADERIYTDKRPMSEKADLLTGMAILSGLISPSLPIELINRRRDIMIESAAYDFIKQEGIKEGRQEGRQEGRIQEAREMILEILSSRFNVIPVNLPAEIERIGSHEMLKGLVRFSAVCQSMDEFMEKMGAVSG